MSHFFPGHETSVILYLVLHFSDVWKYEIVWQSQDVFTLSPSQESLDILSLVTLSGEY